jgi:glycosyltransferase involved in cell wall biosynthesis
LGVAAARNTGLELAGGKYVMFLDSDDFLHEKCMERAVSVMESSGADIYQFGYIDVLPEQKILNKEYTATPKYKLKNNLLSKFLQNKLPKSVLIWDKIYKADIAKKITFKNVQPGEDDLYSFETMAVSENMAFGTDILLYHTDNADSMMHKVINEKYTEMRKKVTDEFGLILRKNLENYSKSPKLRTKLIKYYNEHFLFKEYILKPIRKSKLTPDMIVENIGMVEQKIMADKSGNTPLRLRYKIILWLLRKKFYGTAKFIIF